MGKKMIYRIESEELLCYMSPVIISRVTLGSYYDDDCRVINFADDQVMAQESSS